MADEVISTDVNRAKGLAGVDNVTGDIKNVVVDATTGALLVSLAGIDATPNTDLTATGPTTNTFNSAGTTAAMDLVYLGSSSTWILTDADAAATSAGMLGISLEAKTVGLAMNVALPGSFIRNDAWNWTPGAVLYISTTAGGITETQPSGTDDVIRVIGYAMTADVIFFDPSPDYITHT